ncbi:MAG: MarR family transcriptional regulator [Ilumatobacteraceae bacterium]|nr:MarR family transcriptional regulator [Ilumatobacteraceae bacterium]
MSRGSCYDRPVPTDHVDHVVQQWAVERPDVDAGPIRIIGRISRLSRSIDHQLKVVFDQHGLEAWEYDLLAALRRTGAPFELTAGELLSALMITSGAVTNRIDRLEQRGYVRRLKDADDRRVVRVQLTPAGRRVIDAALPDHLDNESTILAALSAAERRQLERLLRKVGQGLA